MSTHCLSSSISGPFPAVPKGATRTLEAEVVKGLSYLHYAAKTLLLFTYTDYKTIFIPITVFATAAAPVSSTLHFVRALAWIWVHLLQCNTSNQAHSREEDAVNRPWRPIPAGRISEKNVALLRAFLVPFCILFSASFGLDVAAASIMLTITTIVYDEFKLAGHWLGKNFCNIGGYVSFEIGATKIMGKSLQLDDVATWAIMCSGLLIFTTIQTQDFADVAGDAMLGRHTFPMSFPKFSRVFTMCSMIFWSVFLSEIWELGMLSSLALSSLGAYIGWRFYTLREEIDDATSYKIYNIWLALTLILPAQQRWGIFSF
jgi:4-hydroxybenzoate polyprenyltransferase